MNDAVVRQGEADGTEPGATPEASVCSMCGKPERTLFLLVTRDGEILGRLCLTCAATPAGRTHLFRYGRY